MVHTIKTTTASVNISAKTDSSRHVTLILDKPAGVNPLFTALNCFHTADHKLIYFSYYESGKFSVQKLFVIFHLK